MKQAELCRAELMKTGDILTLPEQNLVLLCVMDFETN